MIFGGAAVISGAIAAWFEYRHRGQTVEEREKARLFYRQKWQTIQDTKILDLPRKTIIKTLELKSMVVDWYYGLWGHITPWLSEGLFILIPPISGFILCWFNLNLIFGIFVGIFLGYIATLYVAPGLKRYLVMAWIPPKFGKMSFYIFLIVWVFTGIGWVNFLLSKNIALAMVGLSLSFPLLSLILSMGIFGMVGNFKYIRREDIFFLGLTVVLSFTVTMSALIIGYYMSPNSHIPQTMQMMFSNVICDGLTMLCTIIILSNVVSPKVSLPIPIAVLLDIFMAVLLACASLYLGLLGSEHGITIRQTINVLKALSPDGANREMGPYFWAMYTSFLPTLVYLSFISLCWVARLLVLPIANLFFKGSAVEKPHHLTAGLFLLIAAVFAALAVIIGFIPE